jgi:protein-tyrosine phosphatase
MNECKNSLIYVHCMLGADRTGALHVGYMMLEKHFSLDEALGVCESSTSAGLPSEPYMRLVRAYSQVFS